MPTSAKTKPKTSKSAAAASPPNKSPARSKSPSPKKDQSKKDQSKKDLAKKDPVPAPKKSQVKGATAASAPTKDAPAKSKPAKKGSPARASTPATEAKPAAKMSSPVGKDKMAQATTSKSTKSKPAKKPDGAKVAPAADKPAPKKSPPAKTAPTKTASTKTTEKPTKPAKADKASGTSEQKPAPKAAKEQHETKPHKKAAAPRFRTFFAHNDDGAAAAKKLAAAAGLTKLKDEGKRIAAEPAEKRLTKSPLSKKERDHYKEILMLKRAQLVGDVTTMETEALTGGGSGSLSSLPQHMADAGSDTYDQSLNLDLAAGQRKLLREIDGALARIADNTFGICEYLGTPISPERLENTPWARYSIEGAREMEHQGLL